MVWTKKWSGIIIATVLALLVSACSQGGNSANPPQPNTEQTGTNGTQGAQTGEKPSDNAAELSGSGGGSRPKLPLFDKPVELSWFVELDARVAATKKSYAEVEAFKLLEKETGVKINFKHPPAGMTNEQFNLMISSGDLTDIMTYSWPSYPGGPEKAIHDGIILPLNDLIDKYAPNLKKFLEEHPDIKKEVVTDNGTIYYFPLTRSEKWLRYVFGFQLRQDWLDKLGLKVPETIDEWYTVLKAFKEQDPGGQGTIPFGNQTSKPNFSDLPLAYFMSAWGNYYGFYQVDGQVKFGPADPEYKEYLETMHKWYKEGLIDPDFAATDAKQFDAKVTGHKIGAFGALLNGGMGRLSDLMKDDPEFKLVGAPMPRAKDGKVYNFHKDASRGAVGSGNAVAATSKKAAEAVAWMDAAGWSEWGHNIMNFGIEGVSYNWVDGYPKYTDAVLKHPELPVVNALNQYAFSSGSGRFFDQDARYFEQVLTYPQQKEASVLWSKASTERQLPPVTPTPEEANRLASITNEVFTYTDSMFVKFIIGEEPLSNFDAYIQQLKQMKIDEAIRIYQAALERYNNR